jgi:hypothetical protein
MGTVFRLDTDELSALSPLLELRGYDLTKAADGVGTPLLPVLPATAVETEQQRTSVGPTSTRARITPAMFLLCSTPDHPVEITIEGDSLTARRARRSEDTR